MKGRYLTITQESHSDPAGGSRRPVFSILLGVKAVCASGGVHVQPQSTRWAARLIRSRHPRRIRRLFGMAGIVAKTTPSEGAVSRRMASLLPAPCYPACLVARYDRRACDLALCCADTILARKPGQIVPGFQLVDTRTGQLNRLSDHRGYVVVVVFVGTSCPVGDLYVPRLIELAGLYESQAVVFLAINSNDSESIDDVVEHARRSHMTFPVLKDPENRVADRLLVERTCEALVIDASGRLRYRGAIDDQYGLGSRRDTPSHDYLKDAIDAVLAGRAVSPDLTHVVGCPIERTVPKTASQPAARRVSPPKAASTRERPFSQFAVPRRFAPK